MNFPPFFLYIRVRSVHNFYIGVFFLETDNEKDSVSRSIWKGY